MALTTVSAGNQAKQWDDKFFAEYVRENRFARYMGTDENAIIQLKEDLTTKKGGAISIPLVAKLAGAGVTGNGLLEGNEEALANYDMEIKVAMLRHGVAVTENEEQLTEIGLRNAARAMLKVWAKERMRSSLLTSLASIYDPASGTEIAYANATAAQRDAWLSRNGDRVLFGKLKSNKVATHAGSLSNIDNTDDKLTKEVVSLAKRIAKTASPIIRPFTTDEDEETYVLFTGSLGFRDVKNSLDAVHRDAAERGNGNPLFRDGDLMYDGVIIREIPEMGVLTQVGTDPDGAGALLPIDVQPWYLCGAQSLGVAWAKRTSTRTDVRDYGFVNGVAIQEMRGVRKMVFNNKDHGIVTGFSAGVADA